MRLLPDDHDTRLRLILDWSKLVEEPEDVNPYYLGEMVVTLIHEHVLLTEQLKLLRSLDQLGGGDAP